MEDIDVLIKDTMGIGFGYVYESADFDGYTAIMYQNRINENLNNEEEIIGELSNGKAYCYDGASILECINAILDFWFIKPLSNAEIQSINEIISDKIKKTINQGKINQLKSQKLKLALGNDYYKEAINYLKNNDLKYLIFQYKKN